MSQPGWANAGPVAPQRQPFSIYSMMLVVSFIALTASWLMLKSELNKYGEFPQWDTSKARNPPPAAAPVAPAGGAAAPAGAPGDGGAPPGMVPPAPGGAPPGPAIP